MYFFFFSLKLVLSFSVCFVGFFFFLRGFGELVLGLIEII